ncbi:MAG TPA: hypothetical protein VGT61_09700 [Thermomicrobiales bacterium]|jgi:hypothetical protein|nr:hypothetical protein [Thermomicrobiales bacterium]
MSQQGRPKPLGPERLPDVQPSRTSIGYATFLPNPDKTPGQPAMDQEEPAWWEQGSAATLPDAPRWQAGSLVGSRLPPRSETLRPGSLFDEIIDHGDYHRRELMDEFRGLKRPSAVAGEESTGQGRRTDRDQARRERRERRRQERANGIHSEGQSSSRRSHSRRNRDVSLDWDDES